MSDLTVITVGRDDDYAGDFLKRFNLSVRTNIDHLSSINVDFEYIIVDWFPHVTKKKTRYLHVNEKCSDIYDNPSVRGLIVDSSIASPENLNKNSFYELFAKNAGIRQAKSNWILIVNSDVVIPTDLCDEIKRIVENNLSPDSGEDVFYRTRFRTEITLDSVDETQLQAVIKDAIGRDRNQGNNFINFVVDLDKGQNPDNHVLGAFGGDFVLIRKDVFEQKARGYDETNKGHRSKSKRQATMDTELLLNLHLNGARLRHLDSPYIHIQHAHPHRSKRTENAFNKNGYQNKDDWGFIKYPRKFCFDLMPRILKIYNGD